MATIEKRGPRSFRVKIRLKGRDPIVKSFDSLDLAKRFARDTESQLDHGRYTDIRLADRLLFGEALTRYRDTVTIGKKSAISERSKISLWLKHPLAERAMSKIFTADLAQWRDEQIAAGASPSTIRNKISLVSQVFQTAKQEWSIPVANPVVDLKLPRHRPPRDRRLSDAEAMTLEDFLVQAQEKSKAGVQKEIVTHPSDGWFAMTVRLAIETAMRAGELSGLRWQDVDWHDRTVMAWDTKNGTNRSVPLSTMAMNILIFSPVFDDEYIVPVLNVNSITQAWARLRIRLQFDGLTFHDLRHEATSRLFEKTELRDIQIAAVTGHKTLQMTKRYANFRAADLAKLLG